MILQKIVLLMILLLPTTLFSRVAWAQNATSGLLPFPRHNGDLQEGKHMNLELVRKDARILLFPQTKMGAAVPMQDILLKAHLKNLKTPLIFKLERDHAAISVKVQSPVELIVEDRPIQQPNLKPDEFTFQIKP